MSDTGPDLEKGTYRHVKSGNLYEVIGLAFQTETEEWLVIYRPLYDSPFEFFVRPYDIFIEMIEINKTRTLRFVKIDQDFGQG